MKASLRIASPAGIPLRVHWTFILIIAYVVGIQIYHGANAKQSALAAAFVLAVFACIVLHELGHALAARRYGIKTKDITLLPIGGVAKLQRMPQKPSQELVVAAAGPAVNVLVAALLTPIIAASIPLADIDQSLQSQTQNNPGILPLQGPLFLVQLAAVNIILVLFNMIPAFPMDGGRALRAILAMFTDRPTATEAAARLGQGFAVFLAIAGFFINPILLIIAVFIFLGAASEARQARLHAAVAGHTARDAMITQLQTLTPNDTAQHAINLFNSTDQTHFPVLNERKQLLGIVTQQHLEHAANANATDQRIHHIMAPPPENPPTTNTPLEQALNQLQHAGNNALPVLNQDRTLAGLITAEHLQNRLSMTPAQQP